MSSMRPELVQSTSLHALYDSAFLNYLAQWQSTQFATAQFSPHLAQWQTAQFPAPQVQIPAPVPHKVWIVDCNCGTFLTSRGMKAVLLLRPNVSLFSSDALPINCSAFTSNPEALRPPSCRPQFPGRTCECLTQSLCCHGCGSTIGYMIVIPCTRCTSSVSTNHRHTNGHRFVFHSSEVVGTERLYVPGEPGVVPCETAPAPFTSTQPRPLSPFAPQLPRSDQLPTPPLDLSPASSASPSPTASQFPFLGLNNTPSPPPSTNSSLVSPSFSYTGMSSEPPQHIALKAGDIVYWHHLLRQGELAAVSDDPRARELSRDKMVFDR